MTVQSVCITIIDRTVFFMLNRESRRAENTKKIVKNLFCAFIALLLLSGELFAHSAADSPQKGAENQVRVLCMDPRPPYLFQDERGQVRGLTADLIKAWAARAGASAEILISDGDNDSRAMFQFKPGALCGVKYPVDQENLYLQGLSVRNLGVDFLKTFSSDRSFLKLADSASFDAYAVPFISLSTSVFLPGGADFSFSNFENCRVLVVADSPEEDFFKKFSLPKELIPCRDFGEAFQKLAQGVGDAVLTETYQGKYLLNQKPYARFNNHVVNFPVLSYTNALVILDDGCGDALKLLEAWRDLRNSAEYGRILQEWLTPYSQSVNVDVSLILRGAGLAVLLLLGILAWNQSLKRKVKLMVRQRERILDFVGDGIMAVDQRGRIIMLNKAAQNLMGVDGTAVGRRADDLVPELGVQALLMEGFSDLCVEQALRGKLVTCSKAPVLLDGRPCGAIVTLRDMSKFQAMAEEITGVKMYVESLRINNHEFMNRLQAVSGLIQLKRYDEALNFIAGECHLSSSIQSFMTERIKNPAICGILMGKAGLCREQGIKLILAADSFCGDHGGQLDGHSLVIIVGNLMQNAVEAILRKGVAKDSQISFAIYDEGGAVSFSVRDNAGLLDEKSASRLFVKGCSTKANPSGLGLFTIKNIVDSLGGTIDVDYKTGKYCDFTVTLPLTKGLDTKHVSPH